MALIAASFAILLTGVPGHRSGLSYGRTRRSVSGIATVRPTTVPRATATIPTPSFGAHVRNHVPSDFVFEVDGMKGSPAALSVQTRIHIDSYAVAKTEGDCMPQTNLASVRVLIFTDKGWMPAPERLHGPATIAITAN